MKKLIWIPTVLLVAISSMEAFPRWSVQEDASCGTCHQYNGGGAARNSYGREFADDALVYKYMKLPWQNDEDESLLSFGLDTRYMGIQETDKDLRHFPMQFAVYGAAELESFVIHAEVNRLQEEFRVTGGIRYMGLPLEGHVALQRELPSPGWRVDDHTLYSRGGALTPVNFSAEGMPFTPFIDPPAHVEIGMEPVLGLALTAWAGQGFLGQEGLGGDTGMFNGGKASYRYAGNLMTLQGGLGFLSEGETKMQVASGGAALAGLVWLGEWSTLQGRSVMYGTHLAVMQQLSYRLMPGLELVTRYEFFDPDMDLQSGSLERFSIGLDVFPVSGVELKVTYRDALTTLPLEDKQSKSQILTQIHLYL